MLKFLFLRLVVLLCRHILLTGSAQIRFVRRLMLKFCTESASELFRTLAQSHACNAFQMRKLSWLAKACLSCLCGVLRALPHRCPRRSQLQAAREKDSEIDPVALAIGEQYTRVWAYPPKQAKDGTYHNEGCYCVYCVRVWQSRFKHTFTLAELVVKIGSCSETYERLDKLLKVCVDACVKAGSRSIRIDWSDHDKVQTKVKEIRSTSFCAPEDKLYEYAY